MCGVIMKKVHIQHVLNQTIGLRESDDLSEQQAPLDLEIDIFMPVITPIEVLIGR